jgi:hypothetical protein
MPLRLDVCFSGETDIKNRSRDVCSWPILLKKSEYCLDPFFQCRKCGFQTPTWGTSSSMSDLTETVLNRFATAISVNRRCRGIFGRFATALDFRLFQQNRPEADVQQAPENVCLLGKSRLQSKKASLPLSTRRRHPAAPTQVTDFREAG